MNKNLKSFTIGYDLLYSKYINRFEHIICFQFIPHDKVKIRFSNTSNSEDLLIDDNSYNFISGLAMGIDLKLKNISLNMGVLNLGAAGFAYGASINFLSN